MRFQKKKVWKELVRLSSGSQLLGKKMRKIFGMAEKVNLTLVTRSRGGRHRVKTKYGSRREPKKRRSSRGKIGEGQLGLGSVIA